jgi:hypothetical protein
MSAASPYRSSYVRSKSKPAELLNSEWAIEPTLSHLLSLLCMTLAALLHLCCPLTRLTTNKTQLVSLVQIIEGYRHKLGSQIACCTNRLPWVVYATTRET